MSWTLYSLADVSYGVHPAANANFVANIWRVAEFMYYGDMIGIRALEQLLLQCNGVNLQQKIKTRSEMWVRTTEEEKTYS